MKSSVLSQPRNISPSEISVGINWSQLNHKNIVTTKRLYDYDQNNHSRGEKPDVVTKRS